MPPKQPLHQALLLSQNPYFTEGQQPGQTTHFQCAGRTVFAVVQDQDKGGFFSALFIQRSGGLHIIGRKGVEKDRMPPLQPFKSIGIPAHTFHPFQGGSPGNTSGFTCSQRQCNIFRKIRNTWVSGSIGQCQLCTASSFFHGGLHEGKHILFSGNQQSFFRGHMQQ